MYSNYFMLLQQYSYKRITFVHAYYPSKQLMWLLGHEIIPKSAQTNVKSRNKIYFNIYQLIRPLGDLGGNFYEEYTYQWPHQSDFTFYGPVTRLKMLRQVHLICTYAFIMCMYPVCIVYMTIQILFSNFR